MNYPQQWKPDYLASMKAQPHGRFAGAEPATASRGAVRPSRRVRARRGGLLRARVTMVEAAVLTFDVAPAARRVAPRVAPRHKRFTGGQGLSKPGAGRAIMPMAATR